MKTKWTRWCGLALVCAMSSCPRLLHGQTEDTAWSVSVLDRILAAVPPGQKLVRVGDMEILVKNLTAWRAQMMDGPAPKSAFDAVVPAWTGGDVFYTFDASVSAAHQQAFLDGAREWGTFANLHFILRAGEANYVTVRENASIEGGQSAVGMVGGPQFLEIGPSAWNRGTICHELGHTLGLVHEHQRSDRDGFVTILTSNIIPGDEPNFTKLANSSNKGAYDFYSVMHYSRNALSVNSATFDTIHPQPGYSPFLNIMGGDNDTVLSTSDRAGMALVYGAVPAVTNIVTNTQDSGPGSLRTALYYAFDHPGTTVSFNIPAADAGFSNGVFNILPTDQLPTLSRATTLDGGTQPTNSNPNGPAIVINGALAPPPSVFPQGLRLRGINCTVRGLVINGFAANGILITGSNAANNVVEGCYLGTDPAGNSAVPSGFTPITMADGAHDNTIGGSTASARNVISGSAYQGLVIREPDTRNNVVQGNWIGLNATGTASLPNTWSGVAIYGGAQSNIIGGTTAGAHNIISGNTLQGITVSDTNTTGNVVEGNFIGLNPSGTTALANGWAGVDIFGGAQGNLVGGIAAGAGNVISGNGTQGVAVSGAGTMGNLIAGNFIGVNPTGTAAIGNAWSGVDIFGGAQGNVIGGGAGRRNILSGNGTDGLRISGAGSSGNSVQGNYVGLDVTGTFAIANQWAGVEIFGGAQSNLIGGTSPSLGNVLSGNASQGIVLANTNTMGNVIAGNYVGLGATGVAAVPNHWSGVDIFDGAAANLIGGGPGARNIISGNGNYGISISGPGTTANLIRGNTVGLNAANNASVPNGYAGLALYNAAQSNLIGGLAFAAANLIASNASDGLQMFDAPTTNNTVRGNSIFGNSGVGIALYTSANRSAPAPTLTSAVLTTNTTISGSLSDLAGTMFHLDFYAGETGGFGAQAKTYLGAADVTTSGGRTVNFAKSFAATVPFGQLVTATATDPAGNTSPLSAGVTVTGTDSVGDGIPDAWRIAHFGGSGTTTNSQSCAACDPDHNGLSNWQEFLASTDPTNAASALRVGPLSRIGADIQVSFPSVPGIPYRLEVRDDVASGIWSILADQILGTGGLLPVTDPGAGALLKRFYRVDALK